MCGVCNVLLCVCGFFCNLRLCVCLVFVMFGRVYVGVL